MGTRESATQAQAQKGRKKRAGSAENDPKGRRTFFLLWVLCENNNVAKREK
jgi:hypothetical protein